MKTDPKAIGARIKSVLDKAGMTQRALSERLHVTDPTVSAYIRGTAGIPADVYAVISEIGKVSIDWIITGKEESKSQVTIVSELSERYSPESLTVADMFEVKVEGKTAQERLDFIREIMDTIRKKG